VTGSGPNVSLLDFAAFNVGDGLAPRHPFPALDDRDPDGRSGDWVCTLARAERNLSPGKISLPSAEDRGLRVARDSARAPYGKRLTGGDLWPGADREVGRPGGPRELLWASARLLRCSYGAGISR
jgi:hypothetical protein